MARKFRVIANIPVLGQQAHQQVTVEGSNWTVALGKAARLIRKLPVMYHRRVTAVSLVVEQLEEGIVEQDVNGEQISLPIDNTTLTPEEVEANNVADTQAEQLITEGYEGEPDPTGS